MPSLLSHLEGGFSQASTRHYVRYGDQHGRRWGVNIDNKSGAPVGHWSPPSAPIIPDAHFLRLSKDPDRPNELVIDYDAIIKELREDAAAYEKEAQTLMSRRHGEKYTPGMALDSDIGDALGNRPDPVEPWIAARQGNKYILGLTPTIDIRLVPFLKLKGAEPDEPDFSDEPDFRESLEEQVDPEATGGKRVPVHSAANDWQAFVKERRSQGLSMKQAAAEWKELKSDKSRAAA